MARHARRLITWIGGGILALALLVMLAVLVLVWFVDPNAWRARIAQAATRSLGRPVQLAGDLRWNIGWNIGIASAGGSVANAPGFGATPFAQWQQLRFGLDARALLGRRIVIDQLAIDGLQVNLQRNAAGAGNWVFTQSRPATGAEPAAGKPIVLQVGSVRLRNSQLSFTDARGVVAPAAAAAWQLGSLAFDARLPPDLSAPALELRDVNLRGRLSGKPLSAAGVAVAFEAASLKRDAAAATLAVPAFKAQWDDAQLTGAVDATYAPTFAGHGQFALRVPSVRTQLALLQISLPPMADSQTLGRLDAGGEFEIKGAALAITNLRVALDDTKLDGTVSMPQFTPLALRFDLSADTVDLDRYLEPADYKGKPFELQLAQLQALNVRGVLRMKSATVKNARATELRIDVE